MDEKYSVEGFGLNRSDIDRDLTPFYNKLKENNHHVGSLLHKWKSVEDYVDTLYLLKFVLKLNNKEIDEKTNIPSFYARYHRVPFGWHYETNDFDECMKLHEENVKRLDDIRKNFDKEKYTLDDEAFKKFYNKTERKVTPLILSRSGYDNKLVFLQELYYVYEIKQLPLKDISIYYDITVIALRERLKSLGLTLSLKESQQRAVKNGKRNYKNIMESGRKTMVSNVSASGLFGSKAENVCRTLLEIMLPEKLGKDYEVVVGVNSKTIVEPYEVDIPIMVVNDSTRKYYKFAVEFNGLTWHKERKSDKKKRDILEKKGWMYIGINSNVGISEQKYVEHYQNDVERICDKIKLSISE